MLGRFTPPRDFGPARPFFGADQAGSFRVTGDPPSGAGRSKPIAFFQTSWRFSRGCFNRSAPELRCPFSV
jgi:hypothetical protein